MEITYTITPEDLLQYNLYFQRVSAVGRSQRRKSIAAIVVIAVCAFILVKLLVDDESAWPLAIAVVILSTVMMALLRRRVVRRTIIRHLSDPRIQGAYGSYRLLVSEEGINATTPVAQSQVKWANVAEIVEEPDHVFICLSAGAYVIPRHSYRGSVIFEQLRNELLRLRGNR